MEIITPRRPPPRTGGGCLGLLVLALTLVVLLFLRARDIEWALIKWSVRGQYPGVPWITTEQLAARMEDRQSSGLLLLDVRTPAEWEVSRIRGARRVDPGAAVEAAVADVATDTAIVAYCSVGYRSAEMASRLRKAGFADVRNLDGGIFQWA